MFHMGYHYAYWLNKRTMTAIYVKYHLPSVDWVKDPHTGERQRVEKGRYQFLEMEVQANFEPWRTDTI